MKAREDWVLWAVSASLSLFSLWPWLSAAATLNPSLVWRQGLWIVLGGGAALLASRVAYHHWSHLAAPLYAAALLLLIAVELAGTIKLGAARWLMIGGASLQPSEIAKLSTACVLARYLGHQSERLSLRHLLLSGGLVGVPAALILAQPDLGSASILWAMWLCVVWVAGMTRRQWLGLFVVGIGLLPVGWHLLHDYQRVRLSVFVNPQIDPLGAGYTIIQSMISIGSGQWLGRGWMAGTQNQLNFLPERHADFLYSVIGEEWGVAGGVVVVGLFGCLIWRGVRIASDNSEPEGRLLATALVSWLSYQAIVNMGMVMGMCPVVGIPLPLVSYGGSAMVMTWIAIGLLQSIRRFGTRF